MLDVDATIEALSAQPRATAVLVDFDGSLAPIVDLPGAARPLPGVVDVLAALTARIARVAVVSGRPVEFLAAQLPVPGVHFAGLYGFETLADGVRAVDPRVVPFLDAVAAASEEAEALLPGVVVERKAGVSVTLHWRTTPTREAEVRAVAADLAARHRLDAPQRGKMAVELRPPVAIDKGTVTRALVDGFAVAAFAGDDLGDVPAFVALRDAVRAGTLGRAVRIGVQSVEAPAELVDEVDVVVDGPEGLLTLLRGIAARAPAG